MAHKPKENILFYPDEMREHKNTQKWEEFFRQGLHPVYSVGAIRKRSSGVVRVHEGIDIYAALNTPVVSMFGGQVLFAGNIRNYGKTIIINTDIGGNDYTIIYAHLNDILVKTGQQVSQGQNIGKVGETGIALRSHNKIPVTEYTGKTITGPHLHFEIIKNANIEVTETSIRKWDKNKPKPPDKDFKTTGYYISEKIFQEQGFDKWANQDECKHPLGHTIINPINWVLLKEAEFPVRGNFAPAPHN
ncbi:M23 family metallopeptidase [Candidatus Micrarchaeota archaeon]|nr:M23 family metallopeptidase [Candidatus Micrarchaeota archaeon]